MRQTFRLFDVNIDKQSPKFEARLADFLHRLFRNLLLLPTTKPVILSLPSLFPSHLKKHILEVLFDMGSPVVSIYPSPVLAGLVVACDVLVVDAGFFETTVTPVVDCRPLDSLAVSVGLGGQAVSERLRTLLANHAMLDLNSEVDDETTPIRVSDQWLDSQAWQFLEDLKKEIVCGPVPTDLDLAASQESKFTNLSYRILRPCLITTSLEYSVPNSHETLIIPPFVLERATECLFEGDEDGRSIISAVVDCLNKVSASSLHRQLRCVDAKAPSFR